MEAQYLPLQQVHETPPLQLYTKPQVAEMLSVSIRQLETLVSRGDIKAVRWGRNVRFTKEAIQEFIATRSN